MIPVGKTLGLGAVVLILAGVLAACSETSTSFGRPFRGRSLDVRVVDLERLPALQYSYRYVQGAVGHHRLFPSEKDMELVLVRLQFVNYTASTHLVNIDRQGAELRDFGQGTYLPLDVAAQGEAWVRLEEGWGWADQDNLPAPLEESVGSGVPDPPNWDPRNVRVIEVGDQGVPSGQGFLTGPFELQQGYGLDGWMVFEAPRGTKFRHIRWQAGDTITIPF